MADGLRVLIAGAGLAGLRVAEQLRRRGSDASIVLVGDEVHPPYDRPPLSKEFLESEDCGPRHLAKQDLRADLGVDVRLGSRVEAVDAADRVVRIDGTDERYDELVIATGMTPRWLPTVASDEFENVHVLRTVEDALALRAAMRSSGPLVVVGAGFIGSEVGSRAASTGLDVTVVEPLDVPLQNAFGPIPGESLASVHRSSGVKLLTGVGVARLIGCGRVEEVELTDGARIPAATVLLALGARPNVELLSGSRVEIAHGVRTDQFGRTNVAHVWAAGDVAESFHSRYRCYLHVEHWFTAHEHGTAVADNILAGQDGPLKANASVPYFWSHQHGAHIQVLGRPNPKLVPVRVDFDAPKPSTLFLYGDADGLLLAAVGVDAGPRLMPLRPKVAARSSLVEVLAALGFTG